MENELPTVNSRKKEKTLINDFNILDEKRNNVMQYTLQAKKSAQIKDTNQRKT
jgi:hypothetical protein